MNPILNELLVSIHHGLTDKALKLLFSQDSFSSIFSGVENFGKEYGKLVEVVPSMYHLVGLSGATEFYRLKNTKTNEIIRILSLGELKIGGQDGGVDGMYRKKENYTFISSKMKNKRTVNEINSGRAALEGVANALVEEGIIEHQNNCYYDIFLRNVSQFEDRRKNKRTNVYDWNELDRMFNELKNYVRKYEFSVSKIDMEIRKNLPAAPTLRFHQRLAIAWTVDCFVMGMINLVLLLCARFGKTLMMCELFMKLNQKFGLNIFVLPSHWLSSHTSMKNTIRGYRDFSNMEIVETKKRSHSQIISELQNNTNNGKISVIFTSLYSTEDFQESTLVNVRHWLSNHYSKVLMALDEADFGSHTERAVQVNASLLELSKVKKIYLSGTGVSKMTKGASRGGQKIDDVFSITMSEIQMLKKGTHALFS